MESWRLIRSGPLSGGLNMAVDEMLLEEVAAGRSAPVLRLYRWSPPALTLGYAQKIEGRIDLAACRELGIDVVRRPTGGRAVLHDREATYAVISPERSEIFPGGIVSNYRVIAGVLRAVLESFGLETQFAPVRGRAGEGGANCFVAPSAGELLLRGCKMTGNAQRRSGGAFVQHGSVPVEIDLERLHRVLDPGGRLSPAAGGERLKGSVGWLNRWLPSPVGVEDVEGRIVSAFASELGITFGEGGLTPCEQARSLTLYRKKYTNLAACPPGSESKSP